MTTQTNLDLVWALNAGVGVVDPGDTKYTDGWAVEIPTHQHFNFVLQNNSKNILVGAEQGCYNWQAEISYVPGAKVKASNGILYTNKTAATGVDPTIDTLGNFWIKGKAIGGITPSQIVARQGVLIKEVYPRVGNTTWDCSEITLSGKSTVIQYNTDNAATKSWLLGNISGEMVVVDVGTGSDVIPTGAAYGLADANTHRLFHEGHPPTQTEVPGTIPEAPSDGSMYARYNGTWIRVTTTVISIEPPPPVLGNGAGWYNLTDGQFYLDIDDGDSSQWVAPNPPMIAVIEAIDIQYDNTASGLLATNVQAAIDELAALHP